ncbi:response regulator [Paenalcaligenes sp. Me131]|uniref:response regulator n=1 Tax=Paenalcaligenes sp. Me131 TaxID=3392636 RepID=UPI003D2E4505
MLIPPTRSTSKNVSQALILIVEDEHEIAAILEAYLERSGLRTAHAPDGHSALTLHQSLKPDLILLDIQLPGIDGWQVLNEIRHKSDTPTIMLTALDQDVDKLMGLRIGADDYIVKPFNPAEVVARVQAVLRRTRVQALDTRQVIRVCDVQIDLESHEACVFKNDQAITLEITLTEFKLLECMMRTPNRAFSRSELLEACLPEGDSLERTVDSHISKLRKKIEQLGIEGVPASVRGIGYRFGSRS